MKLLLAVVAIIMFITGHWVFGILDVGLFFMWNKF